MAPAAATTAATTTADAAGFEAHLVAVDLLGCTSGSSRPFIDTDGRAAGTFGPCRVHVDAHVVETSRGVSACIGSRVVISASSLESEAYRHDRDAIVRPLWASRRHPVVHAASLRRPSTSGVVAVLARSKTGKSTLAAAWMGQGGLVDGDDVAYIRRTGPTDWATSSGSRKVRPRMEGARTTRHHLIGNGDLDPHPLRALVVAERGAHDQIERLDEHAACVALSAHLFCLGRERGPLTRWLDQAATLARTVPAHRLTIGEGLEHIPAALERIDPLFEAA